MIRVKLLSKVPVREWARYFTDERMVVGNCQFTFDPFEKHYDWLVVYGNFPFVGTDRKELASEHLSCPKKQTILVTTEPPTIKSYGEAYTSQFGYVLTSQAPCALPHPNRIHSQTGLRWFYGVGDRHIRSLNEMLSAEPPTKIKLISAASSNKKQRHTLHYKRYNFVRELGSLIPELDVFGHGIRSMDDKAEAIDPYFFHVAIENYIGLHHWTEKLADAFLGFALPIYAGAPNVADYFPSESLVQIDLDDTKSSFEIIRDVTSTDEYARRLPYIREARNMVLTEYSLFSLLSSHISTIGLTDGNAGSIIYSKHALRKANPSIAIQDLAGKAKRLILDRFYK